MKYEDVRRGQSITSPELDGKYHVVETDDDAELVLCGKDAGTGCGERWLKPELIQLADDDVKTKTGIKTQTKGTKMSNATFHIKEGLKTHSATKAARKVVAAVKKQLGKNYPAFFSTELGKSVEAPVVCYLVHEAAGRFDFPGNSKIRTLAGYALQGCSSDLADLVSKFAGPLVGDLGGLALLFVEEAVADDDEE
jgi:hypothetical protein